MTNTRPAEAVATDLDRAAEHLCRSWKKLMGHDHIPLEDGCDMHRAIAATVMEALVPEQCGALHPTNDTVVPCVLDKGHPVEEDHFSTTGCPGSVVRWSQYVHPADVPPPHMRPDPRPLCRYEYAGHDGPCEKPPACGKPYYDRNGDLDHCSFPANHDGSCW